MSNSELVTSNSDGGSVIRHSPSTWTRIIVVVYVCEPAAVNARWTSSFPGELPRTVTAPGVARSASVR